MNFSVITPYFNPADTFVITLDSVKKQTYPNFEYLLIDDGSNDGKKIPDIYAKDPRFKLHVKENEQRAMARNYGMERVTGDWIVWLDADDFYFPYYLDLMKDMIEKYPDKKVFNFGGVVCWQNWSTMVKAGKKYMQGDIFRSGNVMSGSFMFHRSCLDKVGFLPPAKNPYTFGSLILEQFPEVTSMYKEGQTDLGNPWGDDWAMFYKLTRDYEPQYVAVAPYMVMIRGDRGL